MEETVEIYDQYYDKYENYYSVMSDEEWAEKEDLAWEDYDENR